MNEYLKRLVIALGGNAILRYDQRGTAQQQMTNLRKACHNLAPLIISWYQVVFTHGNGPQVGSILVQNDRARAEVPGMPLDVCGAESQGQIGYWIQKALYNELNSIGKSTQISSLMTMTLVDANDPAFANPSKPVGPWLTHAEMLKTRAEGDAWTESPQKGWRRVVPSPRPVEIVNSKNIEILLRNGQIVIASGGGGIPVIKDDQGAFVGVEAVIDKDLASERLATQIRAHILMILTDVPAVYLDHGTSSQKPITRISAGGMRRLSMEHTFQAGTIGPKVEAAIRFVENGGEIAVIASLEQAADALKGKTGTTIVPDENGLNSIF